MNPDLTPEEWDLILWALDYCTGVAQEMHDADAGLRTYRLSLKIKAAR